MTQGADPRLSFNAVPDIYDEIRPNYPPAMFDDLFGRLPPRPVVVEVGPGTGQATRDLLGRGAVVHAVEIGPATAAKLRAVLPAEQLHVIVGDFEHVDIPHRSADALFSASAYHWVSPRAQVDRPAAILKVGGTIAIVDLNQVASPADHDFFAAAQPIYDRHSQGHKGPPTPERANVDPPIRRALAADPRYVDVEMHTYDWDQTYTASEYRKLMLSYSGTQMMEPAARQRLLDEMEAFIAERFGGHVTRPLVVTLVTATLGSGAVG